MKVFSLNYHDIEYTVVFATSLEEAKQKAEKRTKQWQHTLEQKLVLLNLSKN